MKKLLFLALFCVAGCGDSSSADSPLDAEMFAKEYAASPGKFKDKEVTIKGRVETPTFSAVGGAKEEKKQLAIISGDADGNAIVFNFEPANRKAIQEVKPNAVVIVKGKCAGKNSGGSITFDNCSLVKVVKP